LEVFMCRAWHMCHSLIITVWEYLWYTRCNTSLYRSKMDPIFIRSLVFTFDHRIHPFRNDTYFLYAPYNARC